MIESDPVLSLYAYYVSRKGWSLSELYKTTATERLFLQNIMEIEIGQTGG